MGNKRVPNLDDLRRLGWDWASDQADQVCARSGPPRLKLTSTNPAYEVYECRVVWLIQKLSSLLGDI